MRFSRAKPAGSFRVFQPISRRVTAHTDTLHEARKDADFWTKVASGPMEIQKRFPSGEWVTIETRSQSAKRSKQARAVKAARTATPKRTSHATKKSAKTGDKINIDQLAKLLGLPDWDKIDEMNQHNYWEMSRGAGDDEDAQLEAERAAQEEVYNQWYDAVESTASKLFDEHGLELDPTGKQGTETRRYDFKIVPFNSWNDAADKIRETINGVGNFHFNSLREFLASGPYTARQAVLSHLGYIKRYPAVYGGSGANQLYEQAWR